jgi:hypothetical protein
VSDHGPCCQCYLQLYIFYKGIATRVINNHSLLVKRLNKVYYIPHRLHVSLMYDVQRLTHVLTELNCKQESLLSNLILLNFKFSVISSVVTIYRHYSLLIDSSWFSDYCKLQILTSLNMTDIMARVNTPPFNFSHTTVKH